MNPAGNYAGDIQPGEALALMRDGGLLVDVRTPAEWTYVGTVAVDAPQEQVLLPWQDYPSMQVNPAFADQLETELNRRGLGAETKIAFLCRSGVRSLAAARAMAARGYAQSFNVAGGFEGNPDEEGHRGRTSGWKAAGLPWKQG